VVAISRAHNLSMRAFWLIALAGCVDRPMSLLDLDDTKVLVTASDTRPYDLRTGGPPFVAPAFSVLLETPGVPTRCVPLASDVSASFAGVALAFEKDDDPLHGCWGWRATLDQLQPGAFDNQTLGLVIHDSTTTWVFDVLGLHDADLQLAPASGGGRYVSITWNNGPPISVATLLFTTPSGDEYDVDENSPGWFASPTAPNSAIVEIPAAVPTGTVRATIALDGVRAVGTPECYGGIACHGDLTVTATAQITVP
jgi:hypothetical protein